MSRQPPRPSRLGFTLLELLVVVAIISILAAMCLAALAILKRQQKVASSLDLMTHLTTAVSAYITDYARLGKDATSADFLLDPCEFLIKGPHRLKREPYISIKIEQLVTKVGTSCLRAEAMQKATHITDHFGNNPANVLSFTIRNANLGGSAATRYVQAIVLRSSAGTYGDPTDDLIFAYTSDKASWRKLRYAELETFFNDLTPAVNPPILPAWKDPLSDTWP
jgi:prepilin-type N-terminal cleavage/methylation domain-containing protein